MKGSEQFTNTIRQYIENNHTDLLTKEGKTIEECINYILIKVQKSGQNGFDDQEIYDMAVEYYTTENVVVGTPKGGRVAVNHHVPAEEPKAKEENPKKPKEEPPKPKAKKKPEPITGQATLF